MSKARLVITAVVVEGRPVAQVATAYAVSRQWIYKLLARYRSEGEAGIAVGVGGGNSSACQRDRPLATPLVRASARPLDRRSGGGGEGRKKTPWVRRFTVVKT